MTTSIFAMLLVESFFQSSFQDLDGHLWEIIWMDPDQE